ncbi:hypothetical protein M409DRAFT_63758 [Zasmidium cellare ATCC 36951]|uniref:Telomere-associated protein Rif1 N-terminal domain-containing protein n=1 Tax=Zasmidium cellare ATCC 36951 TaxID=1080233 RepID=A0A6A6D037_ZASCE|nr:uncharacterized protein M409DRAFT_63758 [Zasmidium cellare ATCC 36951]KAF2171522.1 hypothetical protein M409DRAFT_63758 [Zasmidium cellare ATCC 36951]
MLSSPAEGASKFSHLPARPPTPPRDTSKTDLFSPDTNKTVEDALRFLDEGHQDTSEPASSARVTLSTDTPPPKSSQPRGSTASKKVGFVLEPTNQLQITGPSDTPRVAHDSPAPRSSGPLKSILKRSIEQLPPTPDDVECRLSYFSPQEPGSFRKMLQSVLKQLAGTSRDGRRDAYLCLNGALKQYSDLPEREALVDKMDLLQQFITRDMAWKDSKGEGLDLQIVTQALNLTSALLWDATTEQALDVDFRTFIIDRSIVILEQPDAPKPIVKAHVHILMMQHFPSSIVTGSKVERILSSLQTIEERCSGNSVVAARLTVYQKLVTQQPSVMLSRMEDWIGHVLTGLLSSINDTRIRAIEACHYAALRLGSYPVASKTLFELFDAETDEGSVYCEYFNKRLMEMTSDKELAQFVPQIWVAVILFFRSKRKPLDRYPRLRLFLATIQRCLNSGDMTVKHHAHIAWNKLIFAVSPDSSTSLSMRSMLRLPIMALLDRRGNDKFTLQANELALQSYCHLLNTGLRPNLSHEELDAAWKLYVEEGIEKLVKSGRRTHAHACRLLHGLLQRKKSTYNENAAVESTPIRPEDLPSLDAKWVRSRLGRIIKVVEPVIAAGMCSPPDANEAANGCWRSLFQTVAEAGSQEVKTSNELKIALAELINFFRRLWHTPATSRTPVEISLWLDRYQLLLDICVEALGAAHFVEDFLAKTNADEVEATPTPSNRTSKHQKTAYSPFVFLLALYYQPAQRQDASDAYVRSAAWYLDLLAGARGSASGTIGLLHRSLQFCADQHPSADNGEEIWAAVADSTVHALVRQTSAFLQHNSQTVGTTLRSALNVIIFGLRNYPSSSLCSEKATQLYRAACNFAKHYGGDGGVALGVMEPLAKSLLDMHEDLSVAAGLRICGSILENGVWPKSRQELEQSRKALWSVSLDPPSKTSAAVFDPFDLVYSVISAISQNTYENLAEERQRVSVAVVVDHFAAITKFLSRCPAKIIPSSLKRLQTALSLFAQDRSRALFPLSTPETDDGMRKASAELPSLWADVLRLVQHSFPEMDSVLLEALEPLVTAGLASPSKDIVNHTITFWNESFGSQDTLEYPAKLLPVLRARRAQADMQLPGLIDDETYNVEIAELPVFAESQEVSPSTNIEKARSPMPTSRRSNFLFNSPLGTPYLSDATSATKKRTKSSRKSTPKARLRHDNSQLEFAPIDSTSARPAIQESQMLTEHQKEVKARQHGDAQMFPELSSSPGRSESKGRTIAKKLDFSSDAAKRDDGNQALTTPTAPADANPMSDDLPSSPTPRASGTVQEPDQCSDDDATDIIDPPSSPPRRPEDLQEDDLDRVDETTVDIDEPDAVQEAAGESGQDVAPPAEREEAERRTTSDLVSDYTLPNAQLEREAAAAAAGKGTEVDAPVDEEVEETRQSPAATHDSQDWGSQTPSRVEESFIEQFEQTATPSNAGSTRSTPKDGRSGGKKRQRALDATDSPRKKAKKASPSPIKEFWKRLTGSQPFPPGDGEDDDIEEEIVVASRPRPSLSVEAKDHTSQDVPEPETEQSDPAPSAQEESQLASQPPVKRGRGRPRKHPVDESSQTSTVKAGLKRRASTVSNATRDDQEETSVVAETPALPVTRKAARLSQGASDAGSSLRQGESQEENVDQEADRPFSSAGSASPKNILARLYGVLSDIPKMVFGSQEDERAFDDVLFDIRREVHEAGRRARQQ